MWSGIERRAKRSLESAHALQMQLEASRSRGGLEAIVLADADGLILANAGDAALCAELGAYAPLIRTSPFGAPLPPLLKGANVSVRRLAVRGGDLLLASVGGGAAREAIIAHSIRGVSRILDAN